MVLTGQVKARADADIQSGGSCTGRLVAVQLDELRIIVGQVRQDAFTC
jgi:hypothetical protein